MALSRMEYIKLAEQVRGTILEVVKRASEPVTVRDLCRDAKVCYHFANTQPEHAYVDRLVRDLHKSGVLRKVHISRPKENSRYAYEFSKDPSPTDLPISRVVCATATSVVPADVKVVATKSGTLRVTFRGLSIEIGVEK